MKHNEEEVWYPTGVSEERSWPQDYTNENGRYMHACIECHHGFLGHKSRHICRACVTEAMNRKKQSLHLRMVLAMSMALAPIIMIAVLTIYGIFYIVSWAMS